MGKIGFEFIHIVVRYCDLPTLPPRLGAAFWGSELAGWLLVLPVSLVSAGLSLERRVLLRLLSLLRDSLSLLLLRPDLCVL